MPRESGKKGPPSTFKLQQVSPQPQSQPTVSGEGTSELVAEEDGGVAAMANLQERVRQAEEARRKLRELQEVMALLQGMVGASSMPSGQISLCVLLQSVEEEEEETEVEPTAAASAHTPSHHEQRQTTRLTAGPTSHMAEQGAVKPVRQVGKGQQKNSQQHQLMKEMAAVQREVSG